MHSFEIDEMFWLLDASCLTSVCYLAGLLGGQSVDSGISLRMMSSWNLALNRSSRVFSSILGGLYNTGYVIEGLEMLRYWSSI